MIGLLMPLALIIFLAFVSGYFSLMETALTESHRGRLEKFSEEGNKNAEIVLKLLESPLLPLSVTQVGITSAGILAGFCAMILAERIFSEIIFFPYSDIFSVALAITVTIFIMLFIGEFLPKRAAEQTPEEFLLSHNKSFRLIVNLLSLPVSILSNLAGGTMLLLGMNPEPSDTVTEDEVKDLIEQGTEDGTFEKSERAMVDRIFQLSDQNAHSLMTPRLNIVWLDISDDLQQNLKIVKENPQTIFPVGEGSLDECRGLIYAKDLLDACLTNEKIDLQKLLKKPVFVPRTMEIFRIVEKFKSTGESAAIVNDEYGGVIGFITLDDIAQEIVGIKDLEQTEEQQFSLKKENSWLVDGLYDIDDFKRRFNIETLPDEERDHFHTMGGFLTSRFGYIPKVGETKEWNGLKFEVMNMDRARIDKIMITKLNGGE